MEESCRGKSRGGQERIRAGDWERRHGRQNWFKIMFWISRRQDVEHKKGRKGGGGRESQGSIKKSRDKDTVREMHSKVTCRKLQ